MKGNFAACTLSCLAWWDWFLSWSAAGFRPLVVIHVSFQPIPFFPSLVVSAVLTSNQPYLFIFSLSRYQRSTTAISIGMFPSLVLAFFVLSFRKMELQNLLWPLFFSSCTCQICTPCCQTNGAIRQLWGFLRIAFRTKRKPSCSRASEIAQGCRAFYVLLLSWWRILLPACILVYGVHWWP